MDRVPQTAEEREKIIASILEDLLVAITRAEREAMARLRVDLYGFELPKKEKE